MELWRILLVGAIVAGVVALLLPEPEKVPGLQGGVLVEEGTYVIERSGRRAGEEAFRLWLADGAYRIESALGPGRPGAVLVLDRGWNPLYYAEKGRTTVEIRIVGGRPRVATGSGLLRREVELPVLPPFAFLGAESVAPWFALYRQLLARAPGPEVTVVLAEERRALPAVGGERQPVELLVAGRPLPAEVLPVTLGGREVLLYGQGDLLLGARSADGDWVIYLKESLPDGLQPRR